MMSQPLEVNCLCLGCYSFTLQFHAHFEGHLYYVITSRAESPTPHAVVNGIMDSVVVSDSFLVSPGTKARKTFKGLKSNHEYHLYVAIKEKNLRTVQISQKIKTKPFHRQSPKVFLGPVGQLNNLLLQGRAEEETGKETETEITEHRISLRLAGETISQLDGDGVTVAVFEISYPNRNHPEFLKDDLSSRITYADLESSPTSLSFDAESNHATHICGVIGAKGLNKSAKGIAPKCQIMAFDTNNDLNELMNQLDDINITNHSYGYIIGWDWIILEVDNQERTYDLWLGEILKYQRGEKTDADELPTFGDYNTDSLTLDTIYNKRPKLLSIWSAGNDRNDYYRNLSGTNHYVSIMPDENGVLGLYLLSAEDYPPPGYDGGLFGHDTIGPLATSKNNLTIGSVKNFTPQFRDQLRHYHVRSSRFSSFGPTDSGRVKPDLMALGETIYSTIGDDALDQEDQYLAMSGTSMATSVVTGVVTLLNQLYTTMFHKPPSSATMKALLVHTAVSANLGPSYETGWGLVDGEAAASAIKNGRFQYERDPDELYTLRERPLVFEDIQYSQGIQSYNLQVEGYPKDLQITIVWNDPPHLGAEETDSLTNPLQIMVTDSKGKKYLPWILDPKKPHRNATRGINTRDNVQQIQFLFPDPTLTYTLTVQQDAPARQLNETATGLEEGAQPYSIVISTRKYTVVSIYQYFVDAFFHIQATLVDFWETQCRGLKGALTLLANYLLNMMEGLEHIFQNGI